MLFSSSQLTALAVFALSIVSPAEAQRAPRVWASVVFQRTGERTPVLAGERLLHLTPLGAQQSYSSGQYFRERYLTAPVNSTVTEGARLMRIDSNFLSEDEIYVGVLDQQFNGASAQAFLQGLYPPTAVGATDGDAVINAGGILANGSYVSLVDS